MTQVLKIGAALGLLAAGLAACATNPAYPISGNPAPPATAPTASQASPSPPPAPPAAPPPQSPPIASPAPVMSQPLPPAESSAPFPSQAPAPPPVAAPPARVAATPPRYTATGKVIAARMMFRDYKVRKGDHLDEIARDLKTTRLALAKANRLKSPYALTPGQHLRLPVEKAYEVKSGDTLAAVATRFDIDVAELADLNGMSERERLLPGDELALPEVVHDHGPVLVQAVRPYSRPGLAAGYGLGAGRSGALPRPITAEPEVGPALSDAQITAAGRGRFVWPVRGEVLSAFGVKDVDRRNDGVDVKAPLGAPVLAAAAGDVVYAGDQVPGFGNLVLIKHSDGWVTAYAYLGKINVKMRDTVAQNTPIGEVGQTGGASQPELHFEVRYAASAMQRAKPIDPQLVLPE
jgi:murein DD-endopeptidase MepM/ murein hydrolase activator NlpD